MNLTVPSVRRALACLAAILAITASVHAQLPPSYTMSFDDEFNGTSVNTSVWQYRTDAKAYSQQLAANVSESGGYLHVAVKQQTSGSYSYTGGGVISTVGYGYGYYEASVKVPAAYGWHSSFWAMGYDGADTGVADADQELDFMEQDSGNPYLYTANYHFWPTNYVVTNNVTSAQNMNSTFNTIGCLYTPYETTYYLNGVEVAKVESGSYASNMANIWLTSIATEEPTTGLPDEFLVDWVHYYAPPSAGSAPAAPINLEASSTTTTVTLTWSAPAGAATYNVARSSVSGGPYTTLATGLTTTSYADSTVSGTNPYFYVVSADSSAMVRSANSTEFEVVPGTVIVDDAASSGVTIVGSWSSSTFTSGYYASDYLEDGDAGSGKSVTFTPNLPTSGTYRVLARWTGGSNRATNVPVSIVGASGTATNVTVNQQVNGGTWFDLGAYTFNAGTSGYVTISDTGANGFVIADAIEFVPATVVILDNAASSGVTISGAWTASSYNSGYYGTNYLQDGDTGGGKSVTFAPTLPASGSYAVYGHWAAAANRATNVPISIVDGTGTTTTVTVNEQTNGGTWVYLGTFSFTAGNTGTVTVSDTGANGYVIADAVELIEQ